MTAFLSLFQSRRRCERCRCLRQGRAFPKRGSCRFYVVRARFFFCILIKRMGVRLKSKRGKKKEPCTETLKKELLSPFKYSLLQPRRWGGYKKDLPLGTFIRCWSGSTSWISCEGVFWEITSNTHLEPITRVSQGLLFFVYYYYFYIANQKSTWPVYAPYSYSHFETPSLD